LGSNRPDALVAQRFVKFSFFIDGEFGGFAYNTPRGSFEKPQDWALRLILHHPFCKPL
jgi:hypothetical protein